MKFRLLRIPLLALAACILSAAAFAADPTGSWQWTTKSRGGREIQTTLQLQLQNGQLTGTISGRGGDTAISSATFKDDVVAFSVSRGEYGSINYSGTLSGNTIKGTVVFPGRDGGDPVTRDWTATRGAPATPAPSS